VSFGGGLRNWNGRLVVVEVVMLWHQRHHALLEKATGIAMLLVMECPEENVSVLFGMLICSLHFVAD
jgi:hypothetical protein